MKAKIKLNQNQIRELEQAIADHRHSAAEVRRCQAVLLLDVGLDQAVISRMTGYGRRHCFLLKNQYLANGLPALADKRRGKPKELLTKAQREEVIHTLKTQSPKDVGYPAEYWSTALLGYHIQKHYRVRYKSKTSHYLLFQRAKFTYHKPGRVYQRRNEAEVQAWRKTTKMQVAQALAEPGTVILVEDEMSLSMQTTVQKIWLPANAYPKIEVAGKKTARSIYGFLNLRNGKEHAFKTDWQNMYITADVLGKLRTIYPTQKILLIWDQAPSHKGSKAQDFIKSDGKIETIHFPRAAPEENPQEHVWKNGRSQVSHNRYIQHIDTTTDEFVDYLNRTEFRYSFLGLKMSAIS